MSPTPLPDAADRHAILDDTDVNMVVEAAAGTGKTTCLVGRLMTLFRQGALSGEERLAAVTFTHKAASELRERLERELARALAETEDLDEEEIANLRAAEAALPECHIGTIHSFCARLLRERPVEAGIGPDFRELDDADDLFLRRQAWKAFAAELHRGGRPELMQTFETFGLDQEALRRGFETFADYPDVATWIGVDAEASAIDVGAFVEGVERYHATLAGLRPTLDEVEPGRDSLIPILQILDRRFPRLPRPLDLAAAFRLSGLFKESPEPVQKQWLPFGFDKERVREQAKAYAEFYDETVRPFRRDCLAAVYAAALEAFGQARDGYDRLRRENRVLNFQDLLMTAARMLREFSEVRADLSRRYARLLIDEVQDTDPVQAEIMFLLASSEPAQADWRLCPPRPGALFIVGDPKQSIYRFRRADIVVYQEVKRLIAESGGRVLGLTANFRSQPAVLEWVNRTFGPDDGDGAPAVDGPETGRFGAEESAHGPAYIPLRPGLPATAAGCLSGVFRLETIRLEKKSGMTEQDVVLDEAARIAAFIRDAVDGGLMLPDRDGPRPATPGDFMIVTYRKAAAATYAGAARRLGLACRVSSGGTLQDSPALGLLLSYLKSLAYPDDPILLAAVLRGGLFGVTDPELHGWKKSGGTFSFLAPVPDRDDSPLPPILRLMSEHHRLFRRREPVLALETVLEDLGLWELSCLGDDPALGSGMLATAVELLKAERGAVSTLGAMAERLEWHIATHELDPLPASGQAESAVRIMNLHKTKGLEAPVVFLTGTRGMRVRGPSFAIRRDAGGVSGAMAIVGGHNGERLLAAPAEWEAIAEEEERFLAAERTRLNYVAATRAGAALIISVHQSGKTWKSAFLPLQSPGDFVAEPLPEPESAVPDERDVLDRIEPEALAAPERERERLRPAVLAESYRIGRAKPEADWLPGGEASELTADEAMGLGEVLHRLLGAETTDEALPERARELLREYELPPTHFEPVVAMTREVRRSALWRRADAAERVFREVPYTLHLGGDEGLQRGVIDLVFKEGDAWVVVDYKSDSLSPDADLDQAAARHGGQLTAYAEAWSRLVGEPVVETGIFFLRGGRYVAVPLG